MSRDFTKFLGEDGKLNVRMLPRPVYNQLVTAYRRQDHVFRDVFANKFWLWDLDDIVRMAAEVVEDLASADAAQRVIDGMDDTEWWACMSAFEAHLITNFSSCMNQWSDLLDPVYDDQEQAGWTRRQ